MRNLVIASMMFMLSYNCFAQGIIPPAEGKSVVYFTRISSFGFAINFTYFDSLNFIGKFNGAGYLRYECEPGEHLLWARSENRDFVVAELIADKIYFIEAIPQMGAVKAGVRLEPVHPADSVKMTKVLKLINKKPAIQVTEEEIAAETIKSKGIATKSIEKYQAKVAEGVQITRLEPYMFYIAEDM